MPNIYINSILNVAYYPNISKIITKCQSIFAEVLLIMKKLLEL